MRAPKRFSVISLSIVAGVLVAGFSVGVAQQDIAQNTKSAATQPGPEQSRAPKDRTPDNSSADVSAAWSQLQQSLQTTLRTTGDRQEAMSKALEQLNSFAEDYAGTRQAAIALLNRGALAARAGQYEKATKSLEQAKQEAGGNPQLLRAIDRQLGQLKIRPGKTPPNFTATTIDGQQISLDKLEGKVVLLDFWATWCQPCLAELPNVTRVYKKYHKQGFEIVSISLDRTKQALTQFVKQRDIEWYQIYDRGRPRSQSIAGQYGVRGIPRMILVGADGEIIADRLRGGQLGQAVQSALAEQGKDEADDRAPSGNEQAG
jgi:peroxiredoxin